MLHKKTYLLLNDVNTISILTAFVPDLKNK